MKQLKSNLHTKRWNLLLLFLTLLLLCFSVWSCYAQNGNKITVKGKIRFSDAQVKATVISKYSGRTQVDENGNFVIVIRRLPDTLSISAIGYKTARVVIKTGKEDVNVNLQTESIDLGLVEISTGYQRLKANEINGSIAAINKDQLNARGGANILDRILGQSTGLLQNVGKSANNVQNKTGLAVRGIGTFNGPLDPLIVLDGFIYEGNIDNINPNDIEQVSILKDAAAASIWGARAGNGVIVITSKRAGFNRKLSIGFAASNMIQSLPDLFARPQMSSADYIEVERLKFDKGYYNSRISSTPYLALSPAVELLLKKRNGTLTAAATETGLDVLKTQDTRQNALDAFYTNAQTRQYNVSMQGGSEQYGWLASGNYQDLIGENYNTSKKLNLSFQQEIKLAGNLKLSTRAYVTQNTSKSGRPAYSSLVVATSLPIPYLSFFDEAGKALPLAVTYRGAYTDTLANGKLLDWKYYPAENYKHQVTTNITKEIYATAALSYKILDLIDANVSYQYQDQQANADTYANESSYYTRNLINSFSQYNRSTGVVTYIVPRGGIDMWSITDTKSYTARGQLNMDKTYGNHHINAMAGTEVREVSSTGSGDSRYGYSPDPLTYVAVDPVGSYKNPLTGNSSQIGSGQSLSSTQYRFISNYFNLAYIWKGKYILSGSARTDGSNLFGASTNDKWKPLWSAGLGWNLSDESFYHLAWLPRLKIKATYGYSGNVDVTKTALSVAYYDTNSATSLPFTRVNAINNPGLKWEQLAQLSLTAEFATVGNRLSGSVAFFRKRGTDLYGPTLYDYTTWGGTATITKNVADMSGKGVEVDLHAINFKTAAVKWNTDFYFNYNTSKTIAYYSGSVQGLYNIIGGGKVITPVTGKPLYAIAVYKYAGLNSEGNPMGYLKGVPSTDYAAIAQEAVNTGDNMVFAGPASPVYYGSLINTFRYKSFSLSVNLSYKLGYYSMKQGFSSSDLITNGWGYGDYAARWQKPGDELLTDVPAFSYPANSARDGLYLNSEANVIKADHIRFDYVNLGYKFEFKKDKPVLKNLELYGGMQNLGIIWRANKYHLDPDYMSTYPPTRSVLFGLRGGF